MGADVFEEAPARADDVDVLGDPWPEPPVVICSEATASVAFSLARISARHAIHKAAPWAAVEGCEIVPDRSPIQALVFHPCHESGRGVGFPLDVTNSTGSGLGDAQSEVKATPPGAKGEDVEGAEGGT